MADAGNIPDGRTAPPARAAADDGARTEGNRAKGNILVRDSGFHDDDWSGTFVPWDGPGGLSALPPNAALDVENTAWAEAIAPAFERIDLIRIGFPSYMDGRGFSLARHLRLLGYRGRLRASGHILADQYAMARRSGFDEVEIAPSLARRQPEAQWLFRANWRAHDYQARLRQHPKNGQPIG